jgi:tetratricopeptide (TPR) repeat protein
MDTKPNEVRIINKIGIAYLESNKIDEAYEYYAEKCKVYPKNLDLRYNFAIACFKKEDIGKCREELDKIAGVNPYFPRLYYLKGLIFEKEGDLAKAEAEYIKEVNMNPGESAAWYKIKQLEKNQEKVK